MMMTKWRQIAVISCIAVLIFMSVIYLILLNYNYNNLKPRITQAVKDATGRELVMGGDIRIKIGLAPTLVAYDIRFKNAAWSVHPDMARIKRTEIKVRLFPLLFRQLKIIRLALVEPDILIERDASGRSNLDFGTGQFSQISFKTMGVEKGRINYINHKWNQKYTVAVDSMTATAPGSAYGPVRIKARCSYNGENFDVEGSTGSLTAFEKPSAPWPVDLTVRAGSAVLVLKGGIDNPADMRGIKLHFNLKGSDLSRLNRMSGALPKLHGPFDVSGNIHDTGHMVYSISNFAVLQGASDLSGSMELNAAGKEPVVKALFKAHKLDLRSPGGTGPGHKKTAAAKGKVFPGTPLPLDVLNKVFDAEIRLDAAEVITDDLLLTGLNADILLKKGLLNVRSFKASLGKGSVDGKFSFEPEGKTALLTATMKLRKVEVNSLGKLIPLVKGVEGKLDADIAIKTHGSTVAGLIGASSGKAVLLMGKGRIDNSHIHQLGNLGSTLFRLLNPFEKEKPYTSINCFVGSFAITNGLASTNTLVLNTQYMVAVGEGTINLQAETLDLFLKPFPKQSIGASLINKLGITELTKPLKLTGTLADPTLAIDPTQTAIILGKTIGSATLFGPFGLAAALIVNPLHDDETSCVEAVAAARKGVKVKKGTIGGIGEKVKQLFGR